MNHKKKHCNYTIAMKWSGGWGLRGEGGLLGGWVAGGQGMWKGQGFDDPSQRTLHGSFTIKKACLRIYSKQNCTPFGVRISAHAHCH